MRFANVRVFILVPTVGKQSIVISVSVCLSVCLSVCQGFCLCARNHTSELCAVCMILSVAVSIVHLCRRQCNRLNHSRTGVRLLYEPLAYK